MNPLRCEALERELPGGESGALLEDDDAEAESEHEEVVNGAGSQGIQGCREWGTSLPFGQAVPDSDPERIAKLHALYRPLQPRTSASNLMCKTAFQSTGTLYHRRLSRLPGQCLPIVEPRGHLRGLGGGETCAREVACGLEARRKWERYPP